MSVHAAAFLWAGLTVVSAAAIWGIPWLARAWVRAADRRAFRRCVRHDLGTVRQRSEFARAIGGRR